MQQYEFRAMGCTIMLAIDSDDTDLAWELRRVAGQFAAWERALTRFRDDSELALLGCSGGAVARVSPTLAAALGAALDAARMSEGLVVPTLLAALEVAGYDRSFEQIGSGRSVATVAPPLASWQAIRLDRSACTVRLPPGLRLDLGGVAKGWAAGEVARSLGRLAPTLVSAGGDVAVSGPMADGSPWPIGIANPLTPKQDLDLILLASGAVATSGRDYHRWQAGDGSWQHHIIDPRSGRPAVSDVLSATVIAPDAVSAEAAAKAALILGSDAGLAWIDARPELAGLLVTEGEELHTSARFAAFRWKETANE